MDPQAIPYVIALIIAALISLGVSFYAWRRYPTPGAASLSVLMLSAASFAFTYAMQVASRDLSTALFWYKASFPGAVALAPFWLIFALRYTRRDKWLRTVSSRTWYYAIGLSLPPLLALLLGWTNTQHHLYGSNFRMDSSGAFPLLRWDRGLGFWIHGVYAYTLTLSGAFLLMRYAIRAQSLYRWQVISLFAGALAPLVGNLAHIVIYALDIGTLSQIDLAPFTFPITGIAWAWALLRFKLLKVVPVAWEAVIEDMEDGIIVMDAENRILDINPAMLTIINHASQDDALAHSRSDLMGKKATGLLPNWLSLITQYREAKKLQKEIVVDREEAQYYFDLRISTLQDTRGHMTGKVCILRDITDHKRAEEILARYAAELEQSNQDLEQFGYVISHDLQEPLRMVSSYLKLLERRYSEELDTEAETFIHYAVDGANRMSDMIKAMLQLSRVGTHGKAFVPTDTEAMLEQTLHALQKAIEESNAQVAHDPLPTVMADEVQLRQVFQNLLANAIKFRREGVAPHVHISATLHPISPPGQGEWRFSVSDNGIGITPKHTDRIFQVFQRLHKWGEYPGTGIGLALCKRIVERHGGRIWMESKPGQGATFYFTLPAYD